MLVIKITEDKPPGFCLIEMLKLKLRHNIYSETPEVLPNLSNVDTGSRTPEISPPSF